MYLKVVTCSDLTDDFNDDLNVSTTALATDAETSFSSIFFLSENIVFSLTKCFTHLIENYGTWSMELQVILHPEP